MLARPRRRPALGGSLPAGAALGLVLAVLVATLGGLLARPAAAQEGSDAVPCTVALVPGCDTGDPEGGGSGGETGDGQTPGTLQSVSLGDEPGDEESPAAASAAPGAETPIRSGVDPWERGGLSANFGSQSIPISNYQIGADTTGPLGIPDPLDSFVASQTNWAFTTASFLVLLSTNTLDWAFEFPLAGDLVGQAGLLAQDYTLDFFGFGLTTSIYGLALTVTMVVAGFKAVTKGLVVAGTEVVLAFAAYVVLIVLTLTSSFGDAGLQVSRLSSELSSGVATFAAGQQRQEECAAALAAQAAAGDPATGAGDSAACSFGHAMQRSLIELPYQNIQWGQVLDGVDGKERCAEISRQLLNEGPWGNAEEPRQTMAEAEECQENADFNAQASYIRLGIAAANTVTAGLVTLLVMVVAAMLLWQQVKLLFLTAVLPHTLVFAILPGRSRSLAWRWLEQLVGVVVRTLILALGLVVWLSLFSLIVYEQLTVRGIFLSLFASTAMAVAGFYGLYRLSGITGGAGPISRRAAGGGAGAGDGGRERPSEPGPSGRRTGSAGRTIGTAVTRTVRTARASRSGREMAGAGRP